MACHALSPPGESRYFVLALFTISMIAGSTLYGGIGALIPYVERSFDLRHSEVGLIATVMVLGGLLTVAISGTLCDRFGDKAMLLESGVLMGISGCLDRRHWAYWQGSAVDSCHRDGDALMSMQITFIVFFPITLVRAGGYSAEIAAMIFAGGHLSAGAGRLVWGRLSDYRYQGNRTIPMVYCGVLAAGAAMLLSAIAPVLIGVIAGSAGYATARQVTAAIALVAAIPALLATRMMRPRTAEG